MLLEYNMASRIRFLPSVMKSYCFVYIASFCLVTLFLVIERKINISIIIYVLTFRPLLLFNSSRYFLEGYEI